jgi:hypothetical protein
MVDRREEKKREKNFWNKRVINHKIIRSEDDNPVDGGKRFRASSFMLNNISILVKSHAALTPV